MRHFLPNIKVIEVKVFRGFTLIELLVVIAVIGILAGAIIVVVNPQRQLQRARDTKRKTDIHAIKQGLEEYLTLNGSYPNTTDTCCAGWRFSTTGGEWIPGLNTAYLKVIPQDPLNTGINPWSGSNYSYGYASNGTHYNLVTLLENPEDPDRCELKPGVLINNAGTGGTWCPTYSNRLYSTTNKNN